ncbi:hypothetical protein [Selenomonas sp. AB3002]|uniref:hypothetical protein n=1 Tax=Selenomonas sp. AB3002 TaxID=1392502 RepID=UPI0004952011
MTFLEYQQLKFDKLLDLTKSIESAIHHNTAFAEKYLRLTPFNQEIINTTIDTMLKTQLATSTEEDARASANEKARPGTGELYEERYPMKKEVETMKLPKKWIKEMRRHIARRDAFILKPQKILIKG